MASNEVDVLLLGSGWTSKFLIPLLEQESISTASTTRSGSGSASALSTQSKTYNLKLPDEPQNDDEPESEQVTQQIKDAFKELPSAKMIVQVFPTKSTQRVGNLVRGYLETHPSLKSVDWVQLGSTGAWPSVGASNSTSPIDLSNARAKAEQELLLLYSKNQHLGKAVILNLVGLYGHERQPENFAKKVAASEEALEKKGSLHLIHGIDVARAILGVWKARKPDRGNPVWNRRWIVSDTNVYDWWHLSQTLSPFPSSSTWASNLMKKHVIKALPRPISSNPNSEKEPHYLIRSLDGTDFWKAIGTEPIAGRCDSEERLIEARREAERKEKLEMDKEKKEIEGKM